MPKEPRVEHPAPENAKSPHQTWRILFLDSAENVEQLKEACKDVGYDVIGATTIEEAWAFLDGKNHADVIVCAVHLEEESMFDFLQRVRASDEHRTTKFLMLSLEPGLAGARLDRSAANAGMALGADAHAVMAVFDAPALVGHLRKLQPTVPTLQMATGEEKRLAE